MKIKILFIADGSLTNPILSSQGVPLLEYLAKNGYETFFITFEDKERDIGSLPVFKKLTSVDVKFLPIYLHSSIIFPRWFFYFTKGLYEIMKFIKTNRIEIIHARSLFPSIFGYICKIIIRGKIRLLYDNRGVFIEEEIFKGHWKKNSIKVLVLTWLEKKIMISSNAIVVVSEKFKQLISGKIKHMDYQKIKVIPNRTRIIELSPILFENRLQAPTCVYSGSAAKWQSLSQIEKLFRLSLQVFGEINLKIFTYEIEKFIEHFAKSEDINDRLIIQKISFEKVFGNLVKCNFAILLRENNSVNNVASPIKFAEYLSAGLPVMISEGVGDTEKIVENYNVGIIIKNNDYLKALYEMKKLLCDPGIYLRCRNTATKEFNLQTTMKQYKDIYNELIKRSWKN